MKIIRVLLLAPLIIGAVIAATLAVTENNYSLVCITLIVAIGLSLLAGWLKNKNGYSHIPGPEEVGSNTDHESKYQESLKRNHPSRDQALQFPMFTIDEYVHLFESTAAIQKEYMESIHDKFADQVISDILKKKGIE